MMPQIPAPAMRHIDSSAILPVTMAGRTAPELREARQVFKTQAGRAVSDLRSVYVRCLQVPMSLRTKQIVAVLAVIIAVALVWRMVGTGIRKDGGGARTAVPVTAFKVAAGDVAFYRSGIGTVQAYQTVVVRTRVDGQLVKVAFSEGQEVKKGDQLAQIDARAFEAVLHNAEATLAKDESSLANAQRDLDRYRETAAKGYSSRQQFDTQTAAVTTLSAAVRADKASVENARVQLSYASIAAPIEGRTGIRLVDEGNIVHANDPNGIVVITQVQPISAIFTLPQDQLPDVVEALGAGPLEVSAFSRDGETAFDNGELALIDNQIDPATGTVRLKAKFQNAAQKLWPGQFVNVRLKIKTAHDTIAVPVKVVQRGDRGPFVYVIKADNTVEPRFVRTGPENQGRILITKGLASGEQVVLDGQLRLQPGAKVTIQADPGTTGAGAAAGQSGEAS
jgi:multidrug efflux system membrane fusion protein